MEERKATSSIRTSESQLTAKQPFIKRHWNVYQKWYSTAKEKSTTRWEEWHTHNKIKSHNCHVEDSQSGKQLYHKISPTGVKVQRTPLWASSAWEIWQQVEMTQNIWLEGLAMCACRNYTRLGERLCSWRAYTRPMYTKTQGMKQGAHKRLGQTYWLGYWRVFHGVVGLGNTVGAKTLAATIIRGTHWCEIPPKVATSPTNSL